MKNHFKTLKNPLNFVIAGALVSGLMPAAHAQREAPSRQDRREARQQQMQNMTPEQRAQFFQQRWTERYNAASPEQKARMDEQRAQMNARLKEQGLDPNNPADVAKAMQNGGFGGRGGNRGDNGGGNRNAAPTPAERDAARRALMTNAGITEKTIQDAVIAFMNSEEAARQPLLQLARAAAASLDPNPKKQYTTSPRGELVEVKLTPQPGTDEAVAKSLETYQNALAADKLRHEAALADLDRQISYSTKPRLKSFLMLVGVLDSDSLALGGAAAIFAPAAPPAAAPRPVSQETE